MRFKKMREVTMIESKSVGVQFKSLLAAALLLSAGVCNSQSRAQESAAPAPAEAHPRSWEGTMEVSSIVTNGNTRNQTSGVAADVLFKKFDPWEMKLKAKYLTTISQDVRTAESFESTARGTRKLDDWFDVFAEGAYLKNTFAGVEERSTTTIGSGYFLMKSDLQELKTELAAGYTHEERVDKSKLGFGSGQVAAIYKWKISPTADFSHETRYTPNFKVSEDWRLTSETSLSAAINAMFSSKLSYKFEHVNLPPVGKIKGDTTTTVSILAKF
jgi:putative salt-induced outer membrane protein